MIKSELIYESQIFFYECIYLKGCIIFCAFSSVIHVNFAWLSCLNSPRVFVSGFIGNPISVVNREFDCWNLIVNLIATLKQKKMFIEFLIFSRILLFCSYVFYWYKFVSFQEFRNSDALLWTGNDRLDNGRGVWCFRPVRVKHVAASRALMFPPYTYILYLLIHILPHGLVRERCCRCAGSQDFIHYIIFNRSDSQGERYYDFYEAVRI